MVDLAIVVNAITIRSVVVGSALLNIGGCTTIVSSIVSSISRSLAIISTITITTISISTIAISAITISAIARQTLRASVSVAGSIARLSISRSFAIVSTRTISTIAISTIAITIISVTTITVAS